MGFTWQEALAKINTAEYAGVDGLRRLVNETAAVAFNAAPNATTLLYSGNFDGIDAWKVATSTSASSLDASNLKQIVTIADTHVSELLSHQNFKDALLLAVGGDRDEYRLILDGKDAADNRVTNTGLWDVASRNFADSAVGDVRSISPSAIENSVFHQTEIPALLNNSSVTSINGIPREDLVH